MSIFTKKSPEQLPDNQELVRDFLKGQNLEQVGRVDEAVELYERAIRSSFDAAGPYDRLIFIYLEQRRLQDVIRVARASLEAVQTYPEKRAWYESQIKFAQDQLKSTPEPR